jgi:hypothetical protein
MNNPCFAESVFLSTTYWIIGISNFVYVAIIKKCHSENWEKLYDGNNNKAQPFPCPRQRMDGSIRPSAKIVSNLDILLLLYVIVSNKVAEEPGNEEVSLEAVSQAPTPSCHEVRSQCAKTRTRVGVSYSQQTLAL